MNTEESLMTDNQSVQGQQQSIFGLKEIRESRGISFQKIIEATKVSPQMIQALEGSDFSKLPEPVYTRAFLKSYARVLDIDSTPLIERYDSYCSEIQKPDNKYDHLKKRRHRRSALPRIVLAVIVIALASLAVYYVWGSQSNWYPAKRVPMTETKAVQPPADTARVVTEETPFDRPEIPPQPAETGSDDPGEELRTEEIITPAAEQAAGRVTPEPMPARPGDLSDELVLEIRATELTWIRIIRDNEPPEQLYLRAGNFLTRRAVTGFDIIVGNAGGAEVIFQGASLGRIGNPGEVVSMRLPGDEPPPLKPD